MMVWAHNLSGVSFLSPLPSPMDATDESLAHWVPKGTTSKVVASLRRYADESILYDRSIPLGSRTVLRNILACRDGSFGSNTYRCGGCWGRGIVYSPCGNRHCPDCGWARANNWLMKILEWRLPCCIMHIVFTSPHELNPVFETNPAPCYALYFRCVRETLSHVTSKAYQCRPSTRTCQSMLMEPLASSKCCVLTWVLVGLTTCYRPEFHSLPYPVQTYTPLR